MIIVAGWVDVDPEKRDATLAAAAKPMQSTRAQQGCLDYVWSADPVEPSRIYVYERWESREALTAHFEGPYYLEMRDTIAQGKISGVDVSKYRTDLSEGVYRSDGKPHADFEGEA